MVMYLRGKPMSMRSFAIRGTRICKLMNYMNDLNEVLSEHYDSRILARAQDGS